MRLLSRRKIQELNSVAREMMKGQVCFSAEGRVIEGQLLRTDWLHGLLKVTDKGEIFERARKLAAANDFIRQVVATKKLLYNDGLAFTKLKKPYERDLRRIVSDTWTEWLTCDNAVAAWTGQRTTSALPFVNILNCEDTKYCDAFGVESLQIKLPKTTLTEKKKAALEKRYQDALFKGGWIEWGEKEDELFSVLTAGAVHPAGKAGQGLGRPSLYSAFEAAAIYGLLGIGDWNAATTAKDVIRTVKKGYEITAGNLAGMPARHMTAQDRDLIHKFMKGKAGAYDVVMNFDVVIGFALFDFSYFKDEKWDGVRKRLLQWSGPIGRIVLGEDMSEREDLLKIAQIEAQQHRKAVADFVARTAAMFGVDTEISFCATTMLTWKQILATVNAGCASALMSPQTGRKWLGLDDTEESKLMRLAHKKPEDYTPPFEQKQGLVGGGADGAPNDNPNPQTGGRPKE